jgi:hypothetical protein
MINNTVKTTILSAILVVGFFIVMPTKAYAIEFNPFNPIDPFCLFSCDNDSDDQPVNNTYNTVDSYNVNSYNTTTAGTVNNYSGNNINTTPATPYTPTANTPYASVNNNYNYNNNNTDTYRPTQTSVYAYQPTPVYNYPVTQVYHPTTPVYNYPTTVVVPSYNYYYTPLSVSCTVNTTFSPAGSYVTWTAYPVGGYSNYGYTYRWAGTDNIYGASNSISTYYTTPGVKYAYVTVYSNGQSATAYCTNTVTVGVPIVNYNPNYYVQPVTYTQPVVKKTVYVTKEVVVKATPASTPVVAVVTPTPAPLQTASSLFSLQNVPWGWVGILVILILMGIILYLIFNKKKI